MLFQLLIIIGLLFLVPPVCRRIHIPAIVGFILVGMAFGPFGLGIISSAEVITALGKLGILYILFQSGSEIDHNVMHFQRGKAVVYGLYAFVFPFLIGGLLSYWLLGESVLSSVLMGAMFGSHTLMTYPIVARYGVQKTRSVSIVVGGTMIAMTLSLLVLAVIEGSTEQSFAWWRIGLLPVIIWLVLWLFPRVAHSFFMRHTEPVITSLFVMLLLVGAAYLFDLAGIDGILGAFLCGFSLNRLLPSRSSIMHHVSFVGNSLLVPMFLLSVGMICDVRAFAGGWSTIMLALVMIGSKMAGKWLAAFVAQQQWHLSSTERRLMFALTHASSAGTLAIATIGYNIGVFEVTILNAVIIMVLVLCTLSSFFTESSAKQLALQEDSHMDADRLEERWQLIALSGSETGVRELATDAGLPHADMLCMRDWQDIQRAIRQQTCSMAIYKERQPLNTILRLRVIVPRYAEKERDFITSFGFVRRLSGGIGAKVVFYANEDTEKVLRKMCRREGKQLLARFERLDSWDKVKDIARQLQENDMLVLLLSRPDTAGYDPMFRTVPDILKDDNINNSYVVAYPEQLTDSWENDRYL